MIYQIVPQKRSLVNGQLFARQTVTQSKNKVVYRALIV